MSLQSAEHQWAEFVEFRDLVKAAADRLGIPQPSVRFSAFGRVMLDAYTLGAFDGMEAAICPSP